ncbi:MAG: sensor histidine kinase, partial [Lachnospiraceae bacterium]|nr:sensor histidine kinase [Lachnospiraceae bacterium]
MVRIKDFCDLHRLEGYVSNWAGATGFAAAVISAEGDMLVVCGMDRETAKKLRDFEFQLVLEDGQVIGRVAGGAADGPETSEEIMKAGSGLLRDVLDLFVHTSYEEYKNKIAFEDLKEGIDKAAKLIVQANKDTGQIGAFCTSILLDNALRHSTGSVIEISLKTQAHTALLCVVNEGNEIPPDQQAHLFDR